MDFYRQFYKSFLLSFSLYVMLAWPINGHSSDSDKYRAQWPTRLTGRGRFRWGSVKPCINSKFHFDGKFCGD